MSNGNISGQVAEPVPAATVVVVREASADLQVLMLLRNANLAFNPGHWVFPGGKIDRCDFDEGDAGLEYNAAVRAAVRETEEEAGICISPTELIHTAHWTTPETLPRRYSTWFFICPCRESIEVRIDNGEIKDFCWLSPIEALEAVARGELKVPRPTRTTLEDIRHFNTIDELVTGMQQREIRVFPENSPYYERDRRGQGDANN